jgi:two-component system OmpR family response regulator
VLAVAPDLAILDVLPSGNGFDLARSLRQQRELPIIFLTARDAWRTGSQASNWPQRQC